MNIKTKPALLIRPARSPWAITHMGSRALVREGKGKTELVVENKGVKKEY